MTPWAALDFDLTCLYIGRQTEKSIHDGEKPFEQKQGRYSRGAGKVRKKVKVKPDGTF